MKIKSRFILSVSVLLALSLSLIFYEFTKTLKPQFRKTTEETLIDSSRLLSKIATLTLKNGQIDVNLFKEALKLQNTDFFQAELFDSIKSNSDLKMYVINSDGVVLFDSEGGVEEGKDYSNWRDVNLTLDGKYGARTSHDIQGKSSMYVSSPIKTGDKIIGVLTLVKPTERINSFVLAARNKALVICLIVGLLAILMFYVTSRAITKPIEKLNLFARDIRDGKRPILPNLGKSEVSELGLTFVEMKNALEGKNYIENYVQTLTHEIKAPISAIKGAAELLEQDLSEIERRKFVANISQQNQRIENLVENLLFLSKIENKLDLDKIEEIEIYEIFQEITKALEAVAVRKDITFKFDGNKHTKVEGDPFLLKIALNNLIKNALEFSPNGSEISASVFRQDEFVTFKIDDTGPGIPEYALSRIFEKFYSLPRPDGGRKSSGLGLTFVKEILNLHNAKIVISNKSKNGTRVEIIFRKKLISKF